MRTYGDDGDIYGIFDTFMLHQTTYVMMRNVRSLIPTYAFVVASIIRAVSREHMFYGESVSKISDILG